MERQAKPAAGIVGADGAAAERWVADDEVVSLGDARLGEVFGADSRVRMEEFCNPSRDGIHFDAGQGRLGQKRFRHEGEEEAGPASGLEHATAGEAHAAQARATSPRTMNSGVKCAYCVTRARLASSAGETSCFEVLPEGFPALREGLVGRIGGRDCWRGHPRRRT